jgi:transposase
MFLTDPQWLLLQPLLTPSASRGRPSLDKRLVLENIFWKLTSRQPWYDIPSTSPSWQTCYQHYRRWQHTGAWKSMIKILMADLYDRGGLDLQLAFENHEITITRDCSGQLAFDYPPHLKDTWQLSTAFLILMLLASAL